VLGDAAIAGQGVVLQPSFLVHEAVARGDLVPILGDFRWPESNRPVSPTLMAL